MSPKQGEADCRSCKACAIGQVQTRRLLHRPSIAGTRVKEDPARQITDTFAHGKSRVIVDNTRMDGKTIEVGDKYRELALLDCNPEVWVKLQPRKQN